MKSLANYLIILTAVLCFSMSLQADMWGNPEPCDNVDCGSHGSCQEDSSGEAYCDCDFGYEDQSLQCVHVCDGVDCSGHGTCEVDSSGNGFCNCEAGFHNEEKDCIIDGASGSDELLLVNADECSQTGHCVYRLIFGKYYGFFDTTNIDDYEIVINVKDPDDNWHNYWESVYDCSSDGKCTDVDDQYIDFVWDHEIPGEQYISVEVIDIWNDSAYDHLYHTTSNPCADVTCSGHGSCTVQDSQPVCDCDWGFHNTFADRTVCEEGYSIDESGTTVIEYQGIRLDIPASSVPYDSWIEIKMVNSLEASLPSNISSVITTDNTVAETAYEIKLNGDEDAEFIGEYTIAIDYDESRLVGASGEKNVFVFFKKDDMWHRQEKDVHDIVDDRVIFYASTDGSVSAGTVDVQPNVKQAKGVNTQTPEIKEVDPNPMNLEVSPPEPNAGGTAEVTYPVRIPEGINGMQPNVSLRYTNSNTVTGDAGPGWNLPRSRITIDTHKKGYVRYNGTETYLLDGEKMILVQDSGGKKLYRLEQETTPLLIELENNTFTVHRPDGTSLQYGGFTTIEKNGSSESAQAVLADPENEEKVYSWLLSKQVDQYGNSVEYHYLNTTEAGEPGYNLYPQKITYGYNNTISIDIEWNDSNYTRTNMMPGFILRTDKQLHTITIRHNNEDKRTYLFSYSPGMFNRSLLTSVREYVGNITTEPVNTHRFEYTSLSDDENHYAETQEFPSLDEGQQSFLGNHMDESHMMSNDISYSINNGDSGNVVAGSACPVENSICGIIDMIDFNGDRKLDRIGTMSTILGNDTKILLHDKYKAPGAPERRFTNEFELAEWSIDFEKFSGTQYYSYIRNHPYSQNGLSCAEEQQIVFADMNGDGLPDWLAKFPDNEYINVRYNTGTGFGGNINKIYYRNCDDSNIFCKRSLSMILKDEDVPSGCKDYKTTKQKIIDFNGDGYLDILLPGKVLLNYKGKEFFTSLVKNINLSEIESSKKGSIYDTMIDINGDGLPDHVDSGFKIRYNKAGHFTLPAETWNAKFKDHNFSTDGQQYDIQNGDKNIIRKTWTTGDDSNKTHVEIDTVDINGDGMPDRVAKHRNINRNKLFVMFNTGTGFSDIYVFNLPQFDEGTWDPEHLPSHLHGEYPLEYTYKGHKEMAFRDFNGDGFPDRIHKHRDDNTLRVQYSKFDGMNMLKAVENDNTNRRIKLTYDRIPLSWTKATADEYNDESDRLVLSDITVSSFPVDNLLKNKTTITYENGEFDKYRREFRGFKTVTTESCPWNTENECINEPNITISTYGYISEQTGETGHLGIHHLYDQNLTRQLTAREIRRGSIDGIRLSRTENDWEYTPVVDSLSGETTVNYVSLTEKREYLYKLPEDMHNTSENTEIVTRTTTIDTVWETANEAPSAAHILPKQVTRITTNTDAIEDTVYEETTFKRDHSAWYLLPEQKKTCIADSGSCGTVLSRKEVSYNAHGKKQLERNYEIESGDEFITQYGYNSTGEITSVIKPTGLETTADITYNGEYYRHVVNTPPHPQGEPELVNTTEKYTDIWGRTRKAVKNYMYYQSDITLMEYDNAGRPSAVKKTIDGIVKTVKTFDYFEETDPVHYYGVTVRQLSDQRKSIGDYENYIEAQFLHDTLGRTLQVKRESAVGQVHDPSWRVSGMVERNQAGQIIREGLPFQGNYTDKNYITPQMIHPTEYSYDDFGRLKQTDSLGFTDGNGNTVAPYTVYVDTSFDLLTQTVHDSTKIRPATRKTITDSMGREKTTWTGPNDIELRTKQKTEDGTYTVTMFDHDMQGHSRVHEESINASGSKWKDSLGRLVCQSNPDGGIMYYKYDDTGKLVTKSECGVNYDYSFCDEGTPSYIQDGTMVDQMQQQEQFEKEPYLAGCRNTSYYYDELNRLVYVDRDQNPQNSFDTGYESDELYSYYPLSDSVSKYNQGKLKNSVRGNYLLKQYQYAEFDITVMKALLKVPVRQNFSEISDDEFHISDTIYRYDLLGRIRRLDYPDGHDVSYEYDPAGNLKNIFVDSQDYDAGNSGTYEGDEHLYAQFTYNVYGQRTQENYGNNDVIDYTYIPENRLLKSMKKTASESDLNIKPLHYTYSYQSDGMVREMNDNPAVGNSSWTRSEQSFVYDKMGRLRSSDGSSNMYQQDMLTRGYHREYDFDGANRVLEKRFTKTLGEGSMTSKYVYSHIAGTHRISEIDLVNMHNGIEKMRFAYDNYGSMSHQFMYQSDNATENEWRMGRNFINDSAGRVKYIGDWFIDTGDTLENAQLFTILEFKYDERGNRIRKRYLCMQDEAQTKNLLDESNYAVGGDMSMDTLQDALHETTLYVNDYYTIMGDMHDEQSTQNVYWYRHVSDGNGTIATEIMVNNDIIGDNDSGPVATMYYTKNHLGSTTQLSDDTGKVQNHYLYTPFGEIFDQWESEEKYDIDGDGNGDIRLPKLFTGQELDQETGLYNYKARYYSPNLMVFLRPDPGKEGLNHYNYVRGNPIMYTDPSGKFVVESAIIGVVLGAFSTTLNYTMTHQNDFDVGEMVASFFVGAVLGGVSSYMGAYAVSPMGMGLTYGSGAAISLEKGIVAGVCKGILSSSAMTISNNIHSSQFMGHSIMKRILTGAITGGLWGGVNYAMQDNVTTLKEFVGKDMFSDLEKTQENLGFFEDVNLDLVSVDPRGKAALHPRGMSAYTEGAHISIDPSSWNTYYPRYEDKLGLMVHELTHVQQYYDSPFMPFKYIGQWIGNGFEYGPGMAMENVAYYRQSLISGYSY